MTDLRKDYPELAAEAEAREPAKQKPSREPWGVVGSYIVDANGAAVAAIVPGPHAHANRALLLSAPTMRKQLIAARLVFMQYEQIHLCKSPPDHAKAAANAEHAADIAAVLRLADNIDAAR